MRPRTVLILSLLLLLTGCSAHLLRKAHVGDKKVEYSTCGKGKPIVVYISGLGNTMDTWGNVYLKTCKYTTCVTYNRLGYGRSSKAKGPRTGEQIIEELRRFLQSARYEPPYVLVAHSAAGLWAIQYAKMHPNEVCGMVLVDASHWDQVKWAEEHKKTSSKAIATMARILMTFIPHGCGEEELRGIEATCEQLRNLEAFPDIPLTVITGTRHFPKVIPEEQWQTWQSDLVALSPRGKQVLATRSGHFVQSSQPGLIVAAVEEIVGETRTEP